LNDAVSNFNSWHPPRKRSTGVPISDIRDVLQTELSGVKDPFPGLPKKFRLKDRDISTGTNFISTTFHRLLHHDSRVQKFHQHAAEQAFSHTRLDVHDAVW